MTQEVIPHNLEVGFYKIRTSDGEYSPVFHIEEECVIGFVSTAEVIKVDEPEGFFASAELSQARLDICNSCDKKTLNICSVCKCFMPAKTMIASSACPDNKW